jgi:hypothetical protein
MIMPNNQVNYQSNDPSWHLLTEFSFSEMLSDQDEEGAYTGGRLSQIGRELGIPDELIEMIEMTLRSYSGEALAHRKQGRLDLSALVRVFCQKKVTHDESVVLSSKFTKSEYTTDQESIIHRSETDFKGGWGFFMIRRRVNYPTSSSSEDCNSIDLYLYNEGK